LGGLALRRATARKGMKFLALLLFSTGKPAMGAECKKNLSE
jgi:hypothetical protein